MIRSIHNDYNSRDHDMTAQLPGLDERHLPYYIECSNISKRGKAMISAIARFLLCLFCGSVSVFADGKTTSTTSRTSLHHQALGELTAMYRDHKQPQKQPPYQYLWNDGRRGPVPQQPDHRRLDLGDFDSINKLLQGQNITIPLGSSPPVISFSEVSLTVSSLVCSGLSIGDVDIQWEEQEECIGKCDLDFFASQTEITTMVDIIDLNVACTGTFEWGFRGVSNGQGIFNMNMVDSDATVGLVLAIDDDDDGDDDGDDTNEIDTFTMTKDENVDDTSTLTPTAERPKGRIFSPKRTPIIPRALKRSVPHKHDGVNSVNMVSTTPRTFSHSPPTVMKISSCNAALNVESFTFHLDGVGFVENILNSIGMSDHISQIMGTALCRTLQEGGGDEGEGEGSDRNGNDKQKEVMGDFAALLQPYLPPTPSSYDPLAAEAMLDLPPDLIAVNFMNPTTRLSLLVKQLLDEFSSSPSPLHQFLGESLLNEQGEIRFDIDSITSAVSSRRSELLQQKDDSLFNDFLDSGIVEMPTPVGNFTLEFDYVALLVNRNVAAKQLLNITAVGNYSLQVQMAVENMKIRTGVKFKLVTPAENENGNVVPSTKSYDITIEIPIHSMTMRATTLIVLDEDEILGLTLGDMAKMMNGNGAGRIGILNCLASILYKGELVALEMGPMAVGALQMTRLETFSPGLARVASTLMDIFYGGYAPSLTRAIPNLMQTKLASHINDLLDNAKSSIRSKGTTGGCSSTLALQENSEDDALIDFRQFLASPIIMGLEQNDVVSGHVNDNNETSELGFIAKNLRGFLRSGGNTSDMINGLLGSKLTMLEGESAKSIIKEGELVSVDNRLPVGFTQARVQLTLADLHIQNLDSIGDLSLFVPMPTNGQVLNNSMTLGLPTRLFQMSASVVFGLTSGSDRIYNEMTVGFDLPVSHLIAQIMLRIPVKRLLSLSIQDIMEFECLLPELLGAPALDAQGVRIQGDKPSISFHDVDFSMGSESGSGLNLDCIQCRSPGFQELSELLRQPEEREAVMQSIESIINLALSNLVEGEASYAQLMLDRHLASTSNNCGGTEVAVEEYRAFESPDTGKTSIDYVLTMMFVLISVMCVSIAIWSLIRCFVTRRHRKWLATLSSSQLLAVYHEQTKRNEEQAAQSALSVSMFSSEEVPVIAKYFIPLVILGNIALFLSGHLSIGGSVRVYIQLAGEELVLDDVYVFSISETAVDLWNAGGRVLSAIMFLSSLIWPYVKQFATLVVWFLHPNVLSLHQRGRVLYWLDALAKWSMVDVMIMIVTLSVFAVTISSPSVPFLPDDFYNVGLTVKPMWGLYSNMTAQLVSQVSSHFIVMYQRRIEASAGAKYSASLEMNNNQVDEEHDQLHEVDFGEALQPNYKFDQHDEIDLYRSMKPNDKTCQMHDVDLELAIGPNSSACPSDEFDKPDQCDDLDLELVTNGKVCPFDDVPHELAIDQNNTNIEQDIEPHNNERELESAVESDHNHDASDTIEPGNNNLDSGNTANDNDLESALDIEGNDLKPNLVPSDNVMKPLNDEQIKPINEYESHGEANEDILEPLSDEQIKPVIELNREISDSVIESNANDFLAVIDSDENDLKPVLELHDEILNPVCLLSDEHLKPAAESSDESLDSIIEPYEDHLQSTNKFLEPIIESNDELVKQNASGKPPEPVTESNDMLFAESSLMEASLKQQVDLVADQYDQQYLHSSGKEPNLNHLGLAIPPNDKPLESAIIESIYSDLELPVMKKSSNHNLELVSIDDFSDDDDIDESVAVIIDRNGEKDSAMLEPSENKYIESALDTTDGSMTDLVPQDLLEFPMKKEPKDKHAVQFEPDVSKVEGPEPAIIKPNMGDDVVPVDKVKKDSEVTSNDSNKKSESDDAFLQPRCLSTRDVLPAACTYSTATNDLNNNALVDFESDREFQPPPITGFSTRDLYLPDECFYSTMTCASVAPASDYNDYDDNKSNVSMDQAAPVQDKSDDKVVALFQCIFYRAHHTGRHDADDGLVVRRVANLLMILGALASVALFLAGSLLPSYATESQGLVGIVIGLGGSSKFDHGIFSVSNIIINMTEYFNTTKDKIGLWSITMLFVVTAAVVPIVLVVLYLVRWFYPMTRKSSRDLDIWMEALEAWQYVEVYVVTILLSVWQLGDISEFLMNKQCDSFDSFFATMTYFQILTPQEAQCFKIQPTVEIGTYILLAATILMAILRTWMALAIRQINYQQQFCYLTTLKRNSKDANAVALEGAEMMSEEDKTKDATILVNAIAPFPVLFTDQFRWLLVKA